MIITFENVLKRQNVLKRSVVERARVTNNNSKPKYMLLKKLRFKLSNGKKITIPKGFVWDLSSVPRFLWGLLPPDGDFEVASLIHDYLYITKSSSQKFADDEMLKWSKVMSGTHNKISIRNFDNQVRYVAVRLFGWIVYHRVMKRIKSLFKKYETE